MKYIIILMALLLSSCGGDSSTESDAEEYIGTWKTACITDDPIGYWIETTYEIFKDSLIQEVVSYDTDNCENGAQLPVTIAEFQHSKNVITTDGIEVNVFDAQWSSNVTWESEIGFYVSGDTLYLVSPTNPGEYSIGFNYPFFKVAE